MNAEFNDKRMNYKGYFEHGRHGRKGQLQRCRCDSEHPRGMVYNFELLVQRYKAKVGRIVAGRVPSADIEDIFRSAHLAAKQCPAPDFGADWQDRLMNEADTWPDRRRHHVTMRHC